MRILHTSDWHVGKLLRGNSRADEHRAVLSEIADLADSHQVEIVIVAGDLFETSTPTPESEQIVWAALLRLAEAARHVIVVAGNHDNARRLAALEPLLELGRIRLVAEATRPDDGGSVRLDVAGTDLRLGLLPFVSQRGIIRADHLMSGAAFEHAATYADRMRALVALLTSHFTSDSVNIMVAHAFTHGGAAGGGERAAHLVETYALSPQSFPVSASYVALGHLHAAQKVPGPTAIHYCGSPLQLDFGEAGDPKQVNLVEVHPGAPAVVTPLRLTSGRALRTVSGTLDQLRSIDTGDDWVRVHVREARRADLADDVRALLGDGVVDVVIEAESARRPAIRPRRVGRDPLELFDAYLDELGVDDPALTRLFTELLDHDVMD